MATDGDRQLKHQRHSILVGKPETETPGPHLPPAPLTSGACALTVHPSRSHGTRELVGGQLPRPEWDQRSAERGSVGVGGREAEGEARSGAEARSVRLREGARAGTC